MLADCAFAHSDQQFCQCPVPPPGPVPLVTAGDLQRSRLPAPIFMGQFLLLFMWLQAAALAVFC
jgi:hypothetical protein